MPILHTVNKSPFDRNSLETGLRLATKGSALLFIEDGVYGAMKGTQKSSVVSKAMPDVTFYALGPDLKARGIGEDRLIAGVQVVDYAGFVDLVAKYDATNAWL